MYVLEVLREREREDLCNKRRFGSGKVSNIAQRIALILASLRSISCKIKNSNKYMNFYKHTFPCKELEV